MRDDLIINIGIWYGEQFEKDNSIFIECVVKYKTMRALMIMVYNRLVFDKKIISIEKILPEDKTTLWKDAYEFSNGRLSKEERIGLSKVLYVLKVF